MFVRMCRWLSSITGQLHWRDFGEYLPGLCANYHQGVSTCLQFVVYFHWGCKWTSHSWFDLSVTKQDLWPEAESRICLIFNRFGNQCCRADLLQASEGYDMQQRSQLHAVTIHKCSVLSEAKSLKKSQNEFSLLRAAGPWMWVVLWHSLHMCGRYN